MHEQIANLVYPVLRQGLQLKEQLQAEENLDLQKEQAFLKGLLKFDRLGDEPTTDSTQFLGVRGELRNAPEKLKAWREGVESQLAQGREEWTGPVALQPPTHVPVLQGAGRKQRMLLLAALSLLVFIPLAVFYLVSRLQP